MGSKKRADKQKTKLPRWTGRPEFWFSPRCGHVAIFFSKGWGPQEICFSDQDWWSTFYMERQRYAEMGWRFIGRI